MRIRQRRQFAIFRIDAQLVAQECDEIVVELIEHGVEIGAVIQGSECQVCLFGEVFVLVNRGFQGTCDADIVGGVNIRDAIYIAIPAASADIGSCPFKRNARLNKRGDVMTVVKQRKHAVCVADHLCDCREILMGRVFIETAVKFRENDVKFLMRLENHLRDIIEHRGTVFVTATEGDWDFQFMCTVRFHDGHAVIMAVGDSEETADEVVCLVFCEPSSLEVGVIIIDEKRIDTSKGENGESIDEGEDFT